MSADSTLAADKRVLLARLEPIGQEHLLAFWDELAPADRRQLAEQIQSIDVDVFRQLQAEHQRSLGAGKNEQSHWADLAARAQSPPAMRLDGSGVNFTKDQARQRGSEMLRAGEIGMILVAGGLGTRLGFDQPKGMFRLGPLSNRPLFQILIEQLRAVGRRYSVSIPLYIMTSPATDGITRTFLSENAWFGMRESDVCIFCQGTMWAIDDQWQRILLESKSSLFLGPDGHGGMLAALHKSGSLADAQKRGVKHFFYAQIDNPLTQVCDELFLGCHALAGSEMTTQVVRKREPLERVGNVVSIDGRMQVIEYSDLPDESARQTAADGSLKLWAGNLAIHVMDAEFLGRCAKNADALPFHKAHKKVPHIDSAGRLIEPEKPNAIRFERFIFDLLPHAKSAVALEVDPAEAFAPVKNSDDEKTDNPRTARAAMIALHTRWLREAGVEVAAGVSVEINPLWAANADEVAARATPGLRVSQPTYFAESGPQVISGT